MPLWSMLLGTTLLSKVALTGDSISEQANALIVSNSKIVINNVLQTPVIKTSINFQFRVLLMFLERAMEFNIHPPAPI